MEKCGCVFAPAALTILQPITGMMGSTISILPQSQLTQNFPKEYKQNG